jgi:hypothetical protein
MEGAILYPTEVSLPPGRYVIADPCYHVPEDEWASVLETSNYFNMVDHAGERRGKCWTTFRKPDGTEGFVAAWDTKSGDGEYRDQEGRKYGVDAGMIGIIPLADCDFDPSLGHIVNFDTQFRCWEQDGVIHFGRVAIDTDDGQDDEYDY